MPELPEVRAHAERLTAHLDGVELTEFQPLAFTVVKTVDPPFDAACGEPLRAVRQRGKLLVLDLGPTVHVVHLMQGGRLRHGPDAGGRPRQALARWRFADGTALLLTEAGREHRAGVWATRPDPGRPDGLVPVGPLEDLGPDADALDREAFATVLAGRTGRLHGTLRDQRVLAGLGRRLANEVCHTARLSPFASVATLDDDALDRLHGAIATEVDRSLAFERSRDDMSASKDRPGDVHHRVGEACPTCGDTVRSVEYQRYTVAYCPRCQTGGRVLADNTTSKFLR